MAACGTCKRQLPEDPNEMDEIVECPHCGEIFCSDECASDHLANAHADEVLSLTEEDEDRR